MSVKQSDYEALLAEYSNRESAIALLKQYRPYLEMIPSLRRPLESVITIPLPVARIRNLKSHVGDSFASTNMRTTLRLPCDIALIMCDPEWKIKMGVEIMIFIHHPHEDFSDFLGRWRHTEVYLDHEYEWLMPPNEQQLFSEASDRIYPLFIVFQETPERIKRGLTGASLPFIIQTPQLLVSEDAKQLLSAE